MTIITRVDIRSSSRPASTMQTITRIADLRDVVTNWRLGRESIAFVPTMGNLHLGHASLMAAAHLHGRRVISSIFVNPLQFGPSEDFSAYPRTPDDDGNLLSEYGVDVLFQPTVEEMYPEGSVGSTVVDVPGLTDVLCGAFRPGHFQGVATVVVKLFCLVQPDVAIFGEKDYQQLTVIRRVVQDLNLPVAIVGAPTVRAEDGLALSSRNRYLNAEERATAPAIYRALDKARRRLEEGDTAYASIETEGLAAIGAAGIKPDYFEVRTAARLERPTERDVHLVVLAAGRLGKARLIDNLQCTAPIRK
jgi:pantoate--beta-alanine ligase